VDVVDIAEAIFLERPAEAVCVFGVKEAVPEFAARLDDHPIQKEIVVGREDLTEGIQELDAGRNDIHHLFEMRWMC
jgi:hypothetical protein